jgi:hypothetical protein
MTSAKANEMASEEFADADRDSVVLKQVRDAPAGVDNGTMGTCVMVGRRPRAPRIRRRSPSTCL